MNWKYEQKCHSSECRQFSKQVQRGLLVGYAAGSATIVATAIMTTSSMPHDVANYTVAKLTSLAVMTLCVAWSTIYGYSQRDDENPEKLLSDRQLTQLTGRVLWIGLLIGIFGADLIALAFGIPMGKELVPVMMAGLVALLEIFAGLTWPIYKYATSLRGK